MDYMQDRIKNFDSKETMGLATQTDKALARIEELLRKIGPLREKAAALIRALEEAQHDYDKVVGPVNQEAIRLEAAIAHLRRALVGTPTRPIEEPLHEHAQITPPRRWDDAVEPISAPDIDERRKRSIADHVLYFAADENDPIVVLMNSMLSKPDRESGEMLELIAWGDIWRAAPDWETDSDRLERLYSWQMELEGRLKHWEGEIHRLTGDSRYQLAVKKQELSESKWRAYLNGIALDQAAENHRLAQELKILETEQTRRKAGTDLAE